MPEQRARFESGHAPSELLTDDQAERRIRTLAKPFENKVLLQLSKWEAELETSFDAPAFEAWSEEDRDAMLEHLGRLASVCIVSFPVIANEARRLAAALGQNHNEGMERYMRACALAWVVSTDTNASWAYVNHRKKLIDRMAGQYLERGQTKEALLLLNPYGLAAGERLFRIALTPNTHLITEEIRSVKIDGASGLVVTNDAEYRLDLLNDLIARGDATTERIDAGLEDRAVLAERQRFVDQFVPGAVFNVETTGALDPKRTFQVTCLGSNREELERAYGKAYLSTAGWPTRMFRISIERTLDDGTTFKNENFDPLSRPAPIFTLEK
jgi:hypothetical protein